MANKYKILVSHKFLFFLYEMNIQYLLDYIAYEPFCSIIFFNLSGSFIILSFQNCWSKIFLEVHFYFVYKLDSVYHGKNFFNDKNK